MAVRIPKPDLLRILSEKFAWQDLHWVHDRACLQLADKDDWEKYDFRVVTTAELYSLMLTIETLVLISTFDRIQSFVAKAFVLILKRLNHLFNKGIFSAFEHAESEPQ